MSLTIIISNGVACRIFVGSDFNYFKLTSVQVSTIYIFNNSYYQLLSQSSDNIVFYSVSTINLEKTRSSLWLFVPHAEKGLMRQCGKSKTFTLR
jgi:hypothetical protein